MRITFLPLYEINQPSSRYRVFQFLPYLVESGFQVSVLPAPQRKLFKRLLYVPRLLPMVIRSDVIFVQKRMLPAWLLYLLQRLKVKIIFDIDDAVYLRPELKPKIDRMMRAAKVVIAGNEFLADYARNHNSNVVVIPTVVDAAQYHPLDESRHPGDDRVVIGWIGSDPNRGDLAFLQSVFNWLGDRYGSTIVLRTIGRRPLEMELRLTVEFVQWALATSLPSLQQFDIGIMPLADTDWNRGKCGFKLIQCMAVGAASIASPVGVNQEILRGGGGFLARDNETWQLHFARLIEDKDLRQRTGQAGWKKVQEYYSLQAVLPCLVGVIEQVVDSTTETS